MNKEIKYTALMYHQTTSPARNKYYIPIDKFEEQIKLVNRLNIKSVSLEDKFFGNKENKAILITFDDGHKSNYDAAKILSDYGLKGYFYLVKDFSLHNDDEYLNEREIREISNMGHTLAVHGKDHIWWTLKSENILFKELQETKNWIENITGKAVITCAPPGGVINIKTANFLQQQMPEYQYIRTVKVGINKESNQFIKITPMHTNTNIRMFQWSITNNELYYKYLQTIYHSKNILRPIYKFIK